MFALVMGLCELKVIGVSNCLVEEASKVVVN